MRVIESPALGHNNPPVGPPKRVDPYFVCIYPEPVVTGSWTDLFLVRTHHYRVEVLTLKWSERLVCTTEDAAGVAALLNYLRRAAGTEGTTLKVRKLVKDSDEALGIRPDEPVS